MIEQAKLKKQCKWQVSAGPSDQIDPNLFEVYVHVWPNFDVGQPFEDVNNHDTNPFKTIFVGRLSYSTTEERLKKEFEIFGAIDRVRLVKDLKGKSRGYAFVTFMREREADYAI